MSIRAKSVLTRKRSSREAGHETATAIADALGGPPRVVFAYLTVNHDQPAFLQGLHDGFGSGVPVIGSSGQGVMGKDAVYEDGYAASVCGLSGDLEPALASAREIQVDTRAKGSALGRALRQQLSTQPRALVIHYDPLCGADIGMFLDGLYEQIECPVIGGASGHLFGAARMTTTHQYLGREVMSQGAVAVALSGDFTAEMAICTGCSPVGIDMTVTRAEGNLLLDLDHRPAADVWRELTGAPGPTDPVATSALAIGVPVAGADGGYSVRAAFMLDEARQGLVVQAAIPTGTRVSLHHRTVDGVLDGAARMADELDRRLAGKVPRVMFGFECGARTLPFLGTEATLRENRALQARFAPAVEWVGVTCWGEVYPVSKRPGFHNYTYPLLALAD